MVSPVSTHGQMQAIIIVTKGNISRPLEWIGETGSKGGAVAEQQPTVSKGQEGAHTQHHNARETNNETGGT